MAIAGISRISGTIPLLIAICLFSFPAYAKYSGGRGVPDDPYQIATAEDLIALGETPQDYDKHFILTADIDLDPNLPDRRVFDRAVIAADTNDANWEFDGASFTGVFDGKGHTISHLTITGASYVGLLGGLGEAGEIRNLGMVDVNITGGDYVGGLVGESYRGSVVAQCCSTGSVNGKGCIGGLVGESHGTLTQCYSTVAVQGARNRQGIDGGIGGLVGESFGTLTDCYSIGLVTCYSPDSSYRVKSTAGGLVGRNGMYMYVGVVTNCFWDTETSGQSASNGGVGLTTAEMQSAGTFPAWGTCGNENVWTIDDGRDYPRLWWQEMRGEPIATGATLSSFLMGEGTEDSPYLIYSPDELNLIALFACDWDKHYKLMVDIDMSGLDGKDGRPPFNIIAPGRLHGSEVSFFQGIPFTGLFDGNGFTISCLTVKTDECGGMFGGLGASGEVRNLGIADVNITASGHSAGGLVAWNEGTVTDCYSTGVVGGSGNVGGLVGYNSRGTVSHSYSACRVTGSSYVGGLVGHSWGGTVNQCHGTGAVSSTFWAAGGLVGWNEWHSSVTQCYSTGPASGESSVGGLVGCNEGDVTRCYSTGTVSGTEDVGGLAGENWFGNVTHCYSTGPVTGVKEVGGLLGTNYGTNYGAVTGCFWDIETSGQLSSSAGTGKTTAEMQTASTFLEDGWDFVEETANGTEDIWWILEGQDYPRLWWETR